ncbi:MAG: hypothetical protein ABSF81_06700 [Bacteroidales bacterium]
MIKTIIPAAIIFICVSQAYSQQTVNNSSKDQPKRQMARGLIRLPSTMPFVFLPLGLITREMFWLKSMRC